MTFSRKPVSREGGSLHLHMRGFTPLFHHSIIELQVFVFALLVQRLVSNRITYTMCGGCDEEQPQGTQYSPTLTMHN